MITLDFEVIYFSIFFLVSSILMYTFLDTTIKIIQGINPFFKRNLRLSRTISIISIIGFIISNIFGTWTAIVSSGSIRFIMCKFFDIGFVM
mgnify:CR=1 FL=1